MLLDMKENYNKKPIICFAEGKYKDDIIANFSQRKIDIFVDVEMSTL